MSVVPPAPFSTTYKGHTVTPLVYAHLEPKTTKRMATRRYRAAVQVMHNETGVMQTAKVAPDFEFFGDARRAGIEKGMYLIDNPEDAADPFKAAEAPAASTDEDSAEKAA